MTPGDSAPITATECPTAARPDFARHLQRAHGFASRSTHRRQRGGEFEPCCRKIDPMIRRIAFVVICLLLLATSAAAQPGGDKLSQLQQKVDQATKREGVLTSSIAAMNTRIHSLRGSVTTAE